MFSSELWCTVFGEFAGTVHRQLHGSYNAITQNMATEVGAGHTDLNYSQYFRIMCEQKRNGFTSTLMNAFISIRMGAA